MRNKWCLANRVVPRDTEQVGPREARKGSNIENRVDDVIVGAKSSTSTNAGPLPLVARIDEPRTA